MIHISLALPVRCLTSVDDENDDDGVMKTFPWCFNFSFYALLPNRKFLSYFVGKASLHMWTQRCGIVSEQWNVNKFVRFIAIAASLYAVMDVSNDGKKARYEMNAKREKKQRVSAPMMTFQ